MEHLAAALSTTRLETVVRLSRRLPDRLRPSLRRRRPNERFKLIVDYYEARAASAKPQKGSTQAAPYKPVPPHQLYSRRARVARLELPTQAARAADALQRAGCRRRKVVNIDAPGRARNGRRRRRTSRRGARQRLRRRGASHIADHPRAAAARSLSRAGAAGSLDRLTQVLAEHGLERLKPVDTLADVGKLKPGRGGRRPCCRWSAGFETGHARRRRRAGHSRRPPGRARRRRKRAADFIAEASSLVGRRHRRPYRPRHRPLRRPEDHRGGRRAARLPGDPLRRRRPAVLPVENIELLSRYGSEAHGSRARQARRRRLAGAQGQAQEAPAGDGGRS